VADKLEIAKVAYVSYCLRQQGKVRLKLMLDVTNQVVSSLDFRELLRAVSTSVRRVMRCDAAAIMLPESDGKHLRVHALDFPYSRGSFTEKAAIPIEGTLPGQAFQSGKPTVLNRLDPTEIPPEMYAKAAREGV